jgi:hypothetical protein
MIRIMPPCSRSHSPKSWEFAFLFFVTGVSATTHRASTTIKELVLNPDLKGLVVIAHSQGSCRPNWNDELFKSGARSFEFQNWKCKLLDASRSERIVTRRRELYTPNLMKLPRPRSKPSRRHRIPTLSDGIYSTDIRLRWKISENFERFYHSPTNSHYSHYIATRKISRRSQRRYRSSEHSMSDTAVRF